MVSYLLTLSTMNDQNSHDEKKGTGTDTPGAQTGAGGSAQPAGTGDTNPAAGGTTNAQGQGGDPDKGGPKGEPSRGTGGMGTDAMHSREGSDGTKVL